MDINNILGIIFLIITWLIVVTRLIIRKINYKLDLDDYIIGINLFFVTLYILSAVLLSSNYIFSNKVFIILYYLASVNYYITLWLIKISIIVSYKRITPSFLKNKMINYFIFTFILILLFLIIEEIVICINIFNRNNNQLLCTLGDIGAYSQLFSNIFSDVILFIIPIPILLNAKLSKFNKIRLIIIFGNILILSTIGIIHNIQQIKVNNKGEILWSYIEITVGFIICCLPILYTYIVRIIYCVVDVNNSNYHDLELTSK